MLVACLSPCQGTVPWKWLTPVSINRDNYTVWAGTNHQPIAPCFSLVVVLFDRVTSSVTIYSQNVSVVERETKEKESNQTLMRGYSTCAIAPRRRRSIETLNPIRNRRNVIDDGNQ